MVKMLAFGGEIPLFCVRWVDEYGRTNLCHRSKFTVLSMHGGYLATESLRHNSCRVGSLNNSGITVKECVGPSGLKSHHAWGMRFEECRPRLWTAVGSK